MKQFLLKLFLRIGRYVMMHGIEEWDEDYHLYNYRLHSIRRWTNRYEGTFALTIDFCNTLRFWWDYDALNDHFGIGLYRHSLASIIADIRKWRETLPYRFKKFGYRLLGISGTNFYNILDDLGFFDWEARYIFHYHIAPFSIPARLYIRYLLQVKKVITHDDPYVKFLYGF